MIYSEPVSVELSVHYHFSYTSRNQILFTLTEIW